MKLLRPPLPNPNSTIIVGFLAVYNEEVVGDDVVVRVDTCSNRGQNIETPGQKVAIEYMQASNRTIIILGDKKYWVMKRKYLDRGEAGRRILTLHEVNFSPITHNWIDSQVTKKIEEGKI